MFDRSDLKYIVLVVVSGVVTGIVLSVTLNWMEKKAIIAARAEMERLLLATQNTQNSQSPQTRFPRHHLSKSHTSF